MSGKADGIDEEEVEFSIDDAVESVHKEMGEEQPSEKAPAGNPNHDEKGRFAKKPEQEPEKTPVVAPGSDNEVKTSVAPAPGTEAPSSAPAPETDPSAVQPLEAPKTWSKDAVPFWNQIPARAQAEIMKREQDMFRGLAQYREAAQVGQTFTQTLQPFLPHFQQNGWNPAEVTKAALNMHMNLMYSPPPVKLQLLQKLAKDYGIPLDGIAQADDELYVSPETETLRAELAQMRQTVNGMATRLSAQHQAQARHAVDLFADDPKNIYFEELSDDIARLISSGVAKDLPTAYEMAIWSNPQTRAKEMARQAGEKRAAEEAEAIRKLEDAKKATAANVRTQAHPAAAPATSSSASMDDTLEETLSEIRKRG